MKAIAPLAFSSANQNGVLANSRRVEGIGSPSGLIPDRLTSNEKILQMGEELLGPYDIKLEYSVDRPTGEIVVKFIDRHTGKTVRQIPREEVLALAEAIRRESDRGLLVDVKIG